MGPLEDVECAAPTRLLVIEDSPSDAMLLEAAVRDSVLASATIESESSLGAGLKRLRESTFDGVLIDLGLPDSEGIETFTRVADAAGSAAVVVVTALDDVVLAQRAVGLGAQDYLLKSESRRGELGRAVDYAIRRKRVLQELEQARDEQLEAKDRFLSHVSHELRAPLSVVHQFASLLLDGVSGPLSVDQRDFLTVLMRNVGQLKFMIDDLLEAGRAQSGRLAVVPRAMEIDGLLTDAVAAYQPTADQNHVALDLAAEELPTVVADADRLREVLANLVGNALKFTAEGGRITVEAVADFASVRVTVRDTGRGISPEDLDRIFEQFFQAHQSDEVSRGGLGLGLFVSRDLIERQGGEIWAESRLGHGTAIHFSVPVETATDEEETV